VALETEAIRGALGRGLVPLLYGDVALDGTIGGTIVSTEQVLAFLARQLRPRRLIVVSDMDGVFTRDPRLDSAAERVPEITRANWDAVRLLLGGSRATDVTGGMRSKVEEMVRLVQEIPGLEARILSAGRPGALARALSDEEEREAGTIIRWG